MITIATDLLIPQWALIFMLTIVVAITGWFINKLVGRIEELEKRLVVLEIQYAAIYAKLDGIQIQVQRLANYLASQSELK